MRDGEMDVDPARRASKTSKKRHLSSRTFVQMRFYTYIFIMMAYRKLGCYEVGESGPKHCHE